jgi:hypothetical protein
MINFSYRLTGSGWAIFFARRNNLLTSEAGMEVIAVVKITRGG